VPVQQVELKVRPALNWRSIKIKHALVDKWRLYKIDHLLLCAVGALFFDSGIFMPFFFMEFAFCRVGGYSTVAWI
jgi:hypothetical protein